jgi:sugar lactone lactonase YvrE
VIDLSSPASSDAIVFPQIAAGGGYSTQLILINSTTQTLHGKVSFIGDDGSPLLIQLAGEESAQFSYEIPPNGAYRTELERSSDVRAGYAVVTPDSGQITPAGTAVFRVKQSGNIVTEAGVGASPATTSARIFVDNVASYTGVALANPSDQSVAVTFVLLDRYGSTLDSTTRTLAARSHLAIFAHQLFPGLSDKFTSLMEISSPVPVVPITLKLTPNARSDSVLTTLPVADLTRPPTATSVVFAQIAIGGAFSTRLIFINTDKSKTITGRLSFFNSDSTAMTVPLGSKTDNQFNYQITAGGGRQLLPGNTATIATILLIDPQTNQPTKEMVVNDGQSVRPGFLVLDSTGLARDDFDLSYSSLSTDIATIDTSGNVQGKKAGFSTLTVSSGNVITTGTITVVAVSSGVTGFEITGVAQDLARRLYLANSGNHTILRAQDISQTPEVYAGVSKASGLKNDTRLQSLFNTPAFLAYNQAQGALFVSDSGNNAVRVVQPGPSGTVSTLAAGLNNPRGVALDNRGNLWVADSGSHTIRRINLTSAAVETIAGQAGSPGWMDGKGENARFSSPTGIALETEPLAAQLERERKGLAAPPVSILVADTGNSVIRHVKETGDVETIRSGGSASLSISFAAAVPASFTAPAAVAVDAAGNAFIADDWNHRVRKVDSKTGVITTVAGNGQSERSGDNGPATAASLSSPTSLSFDAAGNLYIVDARIRKVDASTGIISTVAGGGNPPDGIGDGGPATEAALATPYGVAADSVGNLFIADTWSQRVRYVDAKTRIITTIAGTGQQGFSGDGGRAKSAALDLPNAVAIDEARKVLYIADTGNNRLRKVDLTTKGSRNN